MAKGKKEFGFQNCTVSLENNEIVEYGKESIDTFVLSDILKELESPEEKINIKITVDKALVPSETEGQQEVAE